LCKLLIIRNKKNTKLTLVYSNYTVEHIEELMSLIKLQSILIIEDNQTLLRTLVQYFITRVTHLDYCSCLAEAQEKLKDKPPDVVLLDMCLPDGSAIDVMNQIINSKITPIVIVLSGSAEPHQTFDLAQMGVRAFLKKPVGLEELETTIEHARKTPPNWTPHIRNLVGYVPIKDFEKTARETMVEEALARSEGSRRGAAKLLSVSRQLLQHILRSFDA
jgi:two-component system, response regulator RegA